MKEKKEAAKGSHSGPNALRLPPLGEISEWFYSFGGVENRATDKDQGRSKLALFFKIDV